MINRPGFSAVCHFNVEKCEVFAVDECGEVGGGEMEVVVDEAHVVSCFPVNRDSS